SPLVPRLSPLVPRLSPLVPRPSPLIRSAARTLGQGNGGGLFPGAFGFRDFFLEYFRLGFWQNLVHRFCRWFPGFEKRYGILVALVLGPIQGKFGSSFRPAEQFQPNSRRREWPPIGILGHHALNQADKPGGNVRFQFLNGCGFLGPLPENFLPRGASRERRPSGKGK